MQDSFLKNRFEDLARKAYEHNQYTFTSFLNMMEVATLTECARDFSYVPYKLFGGYEGSERVVARFGSEEQLMHQIDFPISCIMIEPMIKKFADEFSHRDFLGALMNLGIERNMIGDIVLLENTGYVFCMDKMVSFIVEQLDQVKHTHIKSSIVEKLPEEIFHRFEEISVIVSSERLDAVLAKVLKLSRSQSIKLFSDKRIFINAKLCESNHFLLKEGDIISVRGFGKLIFEGLKYQTKKDKMCIKLKRYL